MGGVSTVPALVGSASLPGDLALDDAADSVVLRSDAVCPDGGDCAFALPRRSGWVPKMSGAHSEATVYDPRHMSPLPGEYDWEGDDGPWGNKLRFGTGSHSLWSWPPEEDEGADRRYVLAFQATGCPNQRPDTNWWKTQSDETVFQDMYAYCSLVASGEADPVQRERCCSGETLCSPSCTLLRHFPEDQGGA